MGVIPGYHSNLFAAPVSVLFSRIGVGSKKDFPFYPERNTTLNIPSGIIYW